MKKIACLQQAGYDLGYGHGLHQQAPPEAAKRADKQLLWGHIVYHAFRES
ncbi:MAG: hypothetical protein ACRED0_11085 [Gammaproteobacteria bacterium]